MRLHHRFATGNARFVLIGLVAYGLTSCASPAHLPAMPLSTASDPAHRAFPTISRRTALLYVSGAAPQSVLFYSYPGLQLRGKITGIKELQGLCVDNRTGNVWVVSGAFKNTVTEYRHGETKPIKTLRVGTPGSIQSCAVDANSGDIAVGVSFGDSPGYVAVFQDGRPPATSYTDRRLFAYYFGTYDPSGNLFVDGFPSSRIAELPAGHLHFKNIPIKGAKLRYPGSLQYDGNRLAIADEKRGVIYQLDDGTIVGMTPLKGACFVQQFFIDENKVIVANTCGSKAEVAVYDYPSGGNPVKKLTGLSGATGVALSK